MGAVVCVSVPAPRKVECSDQPPVWNLSLARVWFVPSVQLAASEALVPAVSKPGFNTRLPPETGVFVTIGVLVLVGVFVGTIAVFVGVTVGPLRPTSAMSSNQISP